MTIDKRHLTSDNLLAPLKGIAMTEDEKLRWMFQAVHGDMSKSCYLEVVTSDDCDEREPGVYVMKAGNLCWNATKTDLVFDYLTRHLND